LNLEEKFWSKIEFIPFHECWEWTGGITNHGYGFMANWPKGNVYAHRYSLSLIEDLKENKVIDHICQNRSCVNPKHLRQVDIGTNILENSKSIAALNKAKTHCLRGHEFTEDNTYICSKRKRNCRACRKTTYAEFYRKNGRN